MKPLVMFVFVVALNISLLFVRLASPVYIPVYVCQCLLGIHVQPQYSLGLGIWSCSKLISVRPLDLAIPNQKEENRFCLYSNLTEKIWRMLNFLKFL